jgi:regulatory protein
MALYIRKDATRLSSPDTPPLTLQQAHELSLKRLSVREYSVSELRRYLERKGAPRDTAREVVEELRARGQLSDERYSRVLTRHQAVRGKGPRYILMKLRQKGVSTDLQAARKLFTEVAPRSELEAARQLVELKYPGADRDPRVSQRAYRGLISRGFSSEVARLCVLHPPAASTDDDESS